MQILSLNMFLLFPRSSKNDESKTSHGMVALHSADEPLHADDNRLPAAVLTATNLQLPTAPSEQIHSSIASAGGGTKVRREAKLAQESRVR